MKKVISFLMCTVLLISMAHISAFAIESNDKLVSQSTEYLENGDYIISEIYENAIQPRSGKTGYNATTYYNANGVAVWDVVVTGTFTYNGSTSSATSAEATVRIYNDKAVFISKNAYTSGNKATATGTIRYNLVQQTLSASVSCDKNGNLY